MRTRFINFFFFFNNPATTEIYTLPLHDALPISRASSASGSTRTCRRKAGRGGCSTRRCSSTSTASRSEEHTSELQSRSDLVCRLLLEKKKTDARNLSQVPRFFKSDPCFNSARNI